MRSVIWIIFTHSTYNLFSWTFFPLSTQQTRCTHPYFCAARLPCHITFCAIYIKLTVKPLQAVFRLWTIFPVVLRLILAQDDDGSGGFVVWNYDLLSSTCTDIRIIYCLLGFKVRDTMLRIYILVLSSCFMIWLKRDYEPQILINMAIKYTDQHSLDNYTTNKVDVNKLFYNNLDNCSYI